MIFVFLFAGNGPLLDKIKKLVNKKNLDKYIKFLGSRSDAPDLLRSCDVFFLPTVSESQCNALIEAMHYKCPIVTTDIPENKEILENMKEALLVSVRSPKEMAFAIDELLNNKKLKDKLIHNAFKKSGLFSVDKMVSSYERIYKGLLN